MINQKNKAGCTLLHNSDISPEVLKKILAAFPDKDSCIQAIMNKCTLGCSVLRCLATEPELLQVLLDQFPSDEARLNAIQEIRRGYTTLAISAGNFDSLKMLLSLYPNDQARLLAILSGDKFRHSALAVSLSNLSSFNFLLGLFPDKESQVAAFIRKSECDAPFYTMYNVDLEVMKYVFKKIYSPDLLLKELMESEAIRSQVAANQQVEQVLSFVPASNRLNILLLPCQYYSLFLTERAYSSDSISKRLLLLPESDRWKAILAKDQSDKSWLDYYVKTAQDCKLLLNMSNNHILVALKLWLLKPELVQTISAEMKRGYVIKFAAQLPDEKARKEVVKEIETLFNSNQSILQANTLIHSLKYLSKRLPYIEHKPMYIELLRNVFESMTHDSKKGAVSFFAVSRVAGHNQTVALKALLNVLVNPAQVDVTELRFAVVNNGQFLELTKAVARLEGFKSIEALFEHLEKELKQTPHVM